MKLSPKSYLILALFCFSFQTEKIQLGVDQAKLEMIQFGIQLGVDYSETVTCYQAHQESKACTFCPACHIPKAGLQMLMWLI